MSNYIIFYRLFDCILYFSLFLTKAMETYRYSDGVNDDDLDNSNQAISLA
jgi:hypothetical protein